MQPPRRRSPLPLSVAPPVPAPSELFAHRSFMRLWVARLAGTGGNQMLMLALGWQMYDLTGSAWDLGLVGLLQFLPSLPLVLPAGHAIDRFHRARLLSVCLACQVALQPGQPRPHTASKLFSQP